MPKNNLLVKKFKNTESAQLCTARPPDQCLDHFRPFVHTCTDHWAQGDGNYGAVVIIMTGKICNCAILTIESGGYVADNVQS